jgi:hypothetical protein
MTPERLLPLVEAEDRLERGEAIGIDHLGRASGGGCRAGMGGQGVQHLGEVATLVGVMVNPAPLQAAERLDLLDQPRPSGLRQPVEVQWAPA